MNNNIEKIALASDKKMHSATASGINKSNRTKRHDALETALVEKLPGVLEKAFKSMFEKDDNKKDLIQFEDQFRKACVLYNHWYVSNQFLLLYFLFLDSYLIFIHVHYSCDEVDDTITEYQKYKCSKSADEECITHLRQVVSRKSKRMKEAGEEKMYWRKKRDSLREMLDSKESEPGKDNMEMDDEDSEDDDSESEGDDLDEEKQKSDEERDANYESDMKDYNYDEEPTHDMVGKVTDEITEVFDYMSEDLGL